MVDHGHFILKCWQCKAVIEQCRCASLDKEVRYNICDECQKKEGPVMEGRESPSLEGPIMDKVHRMPQGTKFICEVPKAAGRIVDACVFQGQYILACEFGVFMLKGDELVQITFKEVENAPQKG